MEALYAKIEIESIIDKADKIINSLRKEDFAEEVIKEAEKIKK